ncbi:MAG: hypothetical protein ABFD97_05045 [Syntrophobacter sp.]
MARSGRFGKYGDLKRKEQIRSNRVSRSGQAKVSFALVDSVQENRSRKRRKQK